MQRFCSIFSQLLQLFPRLEFEQAVRQHHADRHLRGFPCWGQFVAMLFCQFGQAHSLREICGGLAATEGKLKHLGLSAAPKRSTLSCANGQRPWQLFEIVVLVGKKAEVACCDITQWKDRITILKVPHPSAHLPEEILRGEILRGLRRVNRLLKKA